MDSFLLLSSFQYIVSDEAESLEIEKLRSVDGDSISAEFVTQVYGSIDFLIVEIVGTLDDLDGEFVVSRKLFHVIDFPGIKILPDCEIYAVESRFFYKLEYEIQSISGKRIRTEQTFGFFRISWISCRFSVFHIKKEVLLDRS